MSDIVLSSGVRSNLLQLQQTSDLISQTQTRLATGKRVNSALDNPTNFFTAQSLNGRANDLNSLLDSIGIAQQTLQATNNGLTSITKLIQSAQATARQAQQTTDTTERAALASQFDDVLTQIDQLAGDFGLQRQEPAGRRHAHRYFQQRRHARSWPSPASTTTAGDLAIAARSHWGDATAGDPHRRGRRPDRGA